MSSFPVYYTLLSFSASSKESVTHCRTQIKLSKMGDTGNASSSDRGNPLLKDLEEIYQCPVCLSLPICNIYQCSEGHLICMDCYAKMLAPVRCPTCKNMLPTPPNRCRTAEQVIHSTITYDLKVNLNEFSPLLGYRKGNGIHGSPM